jgi:flagellar hook protein FlgE
MGMGNIATTGMQAAMSDMDIISNNIANAGTVGFKKSTANFADLFPSGNGASGVQIGLGVNLSSVSQDFTAAQSNETGIDSNLSINGNGFFVVQDATSGQTTYSRNGEFLFDQTTGTFVNGNQVLQGFTSLDGMTIPAGSTAGSLTINTAPVPAKSTATVTVGKQSIPNLCSNDAPIPAVPAFDPNNTSTYSFMSNATVYDSLGNKNTLSLYYAKDATANSWTVYAAMTPPNSTTATVLNAGSPGTLTFNGATGALATQTGLSALSFSPTTGATSPQVFAVDMSTTTQFGSKDNPGVLEDDGYGAGTFVKATIDGSGNVNVSYSNNQTVLAGQVALANFSNVQGLQYLGGSNWAATTDSGVPMVTPSNSANNITAGRLEASNVDLAQELVSLITAQNTFQANAQVEQTYNQVMQTVTKL